MLLREPASCSPGAAWGRRLCEVQHRVFQGSLEPGLYWCISALELLWQQLKPTAGSHVALSRVRQMKVGSYLYTNISITLRYKLSSTSLMPHWHFSFKKKTELPAMGWLCWLQVVLKCWSLSASLGEHIPTRGREEIWWPKWCRCSSPNKLLALSGWQAVLSWCSMCVCVYFPLSSYGRHPSSCSVFLGSHQNCLLWIL